MGQHERDDRWFREAAKAIGLWMLAVLFGVFVISQWLTRLLFQFVLNPLMDGLLDRHDGAVVLLSAGLWGTIAALVVAPYLHDAGVLHGTSVDVGQFWLGVTAGGLMWGMAIGVWILAIWWTEAERYMPAGYDVVQLLDAPIDIRQPASRVPGANGRDNADVPEDDLLEALVLGDGPW